MRGQPEEGEGGREITRGRGGRGTMGEKISLNVKGKVHTIELTISGIKI